MNRREFLRKTALATTTLATLESYGQPIFNTKNNASALKIFGTNWGFNGNVDAFCEKTKAAGYDGIEMWWSHDPSVSSDLFKALKKYNLEIGFLVGDGSSDHKKNLENFTKSLQAASENTMQRPAYINCHSGKRLFYF